MLDKLMLASALKEFTDEFLAEGLQVTSSNPLSGLSGRAALLRRLGSTLEQSPAVFTQHTISRPGNMLGAFSSLFSSRLPARPSKYLIGRWQACCTHPNALGCPHCQSPWHLARRTHQIHRRRERSRRCMESVHSKLL